jgi:5-methylcytosine-specific restriction endonuclease McrA
MTVDREAVRMKFGGRCAYCGEPLGARWHADHLEPVIRDAQYIKGKGFVATGVLLRPQNDRGENLMPACPPCNIDKGAYTLDGWRQKLSNATDVLSRNNPTYRHAKRFGLLIETGAAVVFYFERLRTEGGQG